jgi:hypothetical protein
MPYEVEERKTDPEGRVMLPRDWRKRYGRDILMMQVGDEIRILPKTRTPLTKLPVVKGPLKARMYDWHAVKAEVFARERK